MANLLEFLPLFQETEGTIRARLDADVNSGLSDDDPRFLDTREGTFYWDVTQTLVLEFARIYDALSVEVPAAALATFAWGEYLDAHAEVFNLERKPAVEASGSVNFVGDPGTLVASGTVVSAETPDEEGDAIEFVTTVSGTIGAALGVPVGLGVTPANTGGTLPSGNYFYTVTALNEFGETLEGAEVQATVTGPVGSVVLDWTNLAGATRYRVYRGLGATGAKGRVYEGVPSAFTDTGATVPGVVPPDVNSTSGVAIAVEAVEAGSQGNLPGGAITVLDSPNLGVDDQINPLPMLGGTDTELDEELRERILLEYEGRGAGNQNDYRRWALAFPGVGRVFVNPAWNGPDTVQVVVMTSGGDPVAAAVVTGLQTFLDPSAGLGGGEAPIGAVVTVQTPATLGITVAASVIFEDGYSLDGGGATPRRAEILAALEEYIDGLAVGEDVVYEHVKARFFAVEGVYNISTVLVQGGTADVAITSSPPVTAKLGAVTLS